MKKIDLPKKIAVFPLSNFIIFPKTTVPLNIFEPRYVDMINDSMKSNKLIGMIQPKSTRNDDNEKIPDLHDIGCLGKITGFKETEDKRYLIELKGIIRFKVIKERLPNMGWHQIIRKKDSVLFKNINDDDTFYFLHSYQLIADNIDHVTSIINYEEQIVSSVESNNIYGVQFHPEKSQISGIKIIKNFINL